MEHPILWRNWRMMGGKMRVSCTTLMRRTDRWEPNVGRFQSAAGSGLCARAGTSACTTTPLHIAKPSLTAVLGTSASSFTPTVSTMLSVRGRIAPTHTAVREVSPLYPGRVGHFHTFLKVFDWLIFEQACFCCTLFHNIVAQIIFQKQSCLLICVTSSQSVRRWTASFITQNLADLGPDVNGRTVTFTIRLCRQDTPKRGRFLRS